MTKTASIMETLANSAVFFQKCLKEDVMIGVIDHEKFLAYVPSKSLNLGIEKGTPVPKDDISLQKALGGENFEARLPKEIYGFHFYGKTTPIFENGKVVGAIGFGYNIHDQVMLEETILELDELAKNIQNQTNNLAAHSEELATASQEMLKSSYTALENTKLINSVIGLINNISRQTNLLGLNASIEAARAGQYGKGFTVVANEVRKLSSESSKASQEVSEFLNDIRLNIKSINDGLLNISDAANYQAAFAEEYIKMVGQLSNMRKMMNRYTEIIK
ncbi:methyl-accepting chemotaxis protein [Bacillus sp. CGMCC 1.16607]|uniref:methyl-accepting chemotaxis protein n=1 Tax=Bacillus sp. CGMCC 1.16607 TaxID=3351842 RepID=UPI00362E8259